MVSRRFACLFLAVSMTLSSIWIVSADQSHQIQDAAEAAASYSAAVQALEEAGLSQSAQANSNIAIDLGMLEQEETVDLSQLAVQAVQLQQEEEARQAEAARQANREAARRTGRQAARQALLDAYDGAMAARQITVYAPATAPPPCGPCARARWPGSTTSPRTAIGIRSPSAAPPAMSGLTGARPCSTATTPGPPP